MYEYDYTQYPAEQDQLQQQFNLVNQHPGLVESHELLNEYQQRQPLPVNNTMPTDNQFQSFYSPEFLAGPTVFDTQYNPQLESEFFDQSKVLSPQQAEQIVSTKVAYNDSLKPGLVSAASRTSFNSSMDYIQSPEIMSFNLPKKEEFHPPYPTPPDVPITQDTVPEFLTYHMNFKSPAVEKPKKRRNAKSEAVDGFSRPKSGKSESHRVIRGISSGGGATRPPRQEQGGRRVNYLPVNLDLIHAKVKDLCLPEWDAEEKKDERRIIRVERRQTGGKIYATFSIVGSSESNPIPEPSTNGCDVVEVSCLECYIQPGENLDGSDTDGSEIATRVAEGVQRQFYITSVEVIKIVELLIGMDENHPKERRKERGRIRLNLVPFWSKKPICARMSPSSPGYEPSAGFWDFRIELAKRIMSYEVRKPRGFDKHIRILKWENLEPALRRALQSYYVEIPA